MMAIGVFLTSLNDYYIQVLSGAPLPVIGVLILLYRCHKIHKPRPLEAVITCLVVLGICIGLWRALTDPMCQMWPANILGWFVAITMLMIDFDGRQEELAGAFRVFLAIHVGFFFLQAFTYVLSGNYIDPILWFTGKQSRYMEQLTIDISLFSIRPTGLFAEPSNYGASVLPAALLYFAMQKKLTPLTAVAVASVALTFSSWSFAAIAMSLALFIRRDAKSISIMVAAAVFLYLFSDWFFERTFDVPLESGYTSAELRQMFAQIVLEKTLNLSPGLGLGVAEVYLLDFAVNDSGSMIYFLYVLGIYGMLLVGTLFWAVKGWQGKVILVVVLTSKLMPTYPLFWLIMNLLTRGIPRTAEERREDIWEGALPHLPERVRYDAPESSVRRRG